MKLQTKILVTFGAVMVVFCAALMGVRYYMTYKNRTVFESRTADKVVFFEHIAQTQSSTLEEFVASRETADAVRAAVVAGDAAPLEEYAAIALPSFNTHALWVCTRDFAALFHLNADDDPRLERFPLDAARMQRFFLRGSYYRHFFVNSSAGLLEICTAPVGAQAAQVLLAGRLWDERYLHIMSRMIGGRVNVQPMARGEQLAPVYDYRTGTIEFSKVLSGPDRRPLCRLVVQYETPAIRDFNRASTVQVLLLVAFALGIVGMTGFCFMRWVILPLRSVSQALVTSDPQLVAPVAAHASEFGRIARLIQDFFRQQAALVHEVAERKQAEQALRDSEERFRGMVESISDVIWDVDREWRCMYISPSVEKISGYTPEELSGKTPMEFMPADVREELADRLRAVSDRREPFAGLVFSWCHKEGHRVVAESNGTPLYDSSGTCIGFRGVTRDVTERITLEQRLQQSQKMEAIGTLAGGVAHDFNNILAIVMGNVELVLETVPADVASRGYLRNALQACHRARDMVRQILLFSRQTDMGKEPLSMCALLRETLSMLRSTIPASIQIESQCDCTQDTVVGSAAQINQVLVNICTNAVQAMPGGGHTLTVNLDTVDLDADSVVQYHEIGAGCYVRVRVTDTGSGIDAAALGRIFDPFFTTKQPGEGTGLGLSVARGIVAQHGGCMQVSSAPGTGTIVTVLLPLAAVPVPAAQPAAASPTGGTGRLLIVDDESLLVEMLGKMLAGLGYSVTATTDSRDALARFRAAPDAFDLVITDQTMPHMTGDALTRELLKVRSDLPVVICTGFSDLISEETVRDIGACELLSKPYRMHTIAAAVQRALAPAP